jgi:UDP:flavonoid glycosyltransferase YjiC (YdhE family)
MQAKSRAGLLHSVLGALHELGLRGIRHTGMDPVDVGLPPDVLAVQSVPHSWLLPRTAAVAHHCGVGTTAAVLRAGVPSVGVPGFYDQPYWSRRIRDLGVAADPIPVVRLSTDRLVAALRALTGDVDLRWRAAELTAALRREDGVATAVERLHRHLARAPRPMPSALPEGR